MGSAPHGSFPRSAKYYPALSLRDIYIRLLTTILYSVHDHPNNDAFTKLNPTRNRRFTHFGIRPFRLSSTIWRRAGLYLRILPLQSGTYGSKGSREFLLGIGTRLSSLGLLTASVKPIFWGCSAAFQRANSLARLLHRTPMCSSERKRPIYLRSELAVQSTPSGSTKLLGPRWRKGHHCHDSYPLALTG